MIDLFIIIIGGATLIWSLGIFLTLWTLYKKEKKEKKTEYS